MFDLSKITGIYCITCTATGRKYVGKAGGKSGLRHRWTTHKSSLRLNKSGCVRLQNEWNAYGEDTFVWEVLEPLPPRDEILIPRERFWIDHLGAELNVAAPEGSPMLGRKHSEDSRQKMSASHLGQTAWNEGVVGMPWTGRKRTDEIKRKISATKLRCGSNKGPRPYRHRAVERINLRTGEAVEYPSIMSVEDDGFEQSLVGACCRGRRKTHAGYAWQYL